MSKILCKLTIHNWEVQQPMYYRDVSFGEPGASSTKILWVCKRCHSIKEKSYFGVGFLTAEQLGIKNEEEKS